MSGLRERKKLETGRKIRRAALDLFLERGFDSVSTAEIAAAADVSKMTLFNYFATKEDLVMGPMAEHADEPARIVRARPGGKTPVEALREQFLSALANRDPATGLSDNVVVLDLQRLIQTTPALSRRVVMFHLTRTRT